MACGSLRRRRRWVGDVDLVLDGVPPDEALRMLGDLGLRVVSPAGDGPRTGLVTPAGIPVDVWSPGGPTGLGPCVLHATGSGVHNALMRRWARTVHGLSATWRGVHDPTTGVRLDDGTEDGIRRLLCWPLLEPWEREVDPLRPPAWLRPYLDEMDRLEAVPVGT